jgi:hypothetical protein
MKLPKVSGSMDVSALARVRLLGPYRVGRLPATSGLVRAAERQLAALRIAKQAVHLRPFGPRRNRCAA